MVAVVLAGRVITHSEKPIADHGLLGVYATVTEPRVCGFCYFRHSKLCNAQPFDSVILDNSLSLVPIASQATSAWVDHRSRFVNLNLG